jgi:hypothetical protein
MWATEMEQGAMGAIWYSQCVGVRASMAGGETVNTGPGIEIKEPPGEPSADVRDPDYNPPYVDRWLLRRLVPDAI